MSIQSNNNYLFPPIAPAAYVDNLATPPSYEEATGQLTQTNHPIEVALSLPGSIYLRKFLYEGTLLNGKPHNKGIAKEMSEPVHPMTNCILDGIFSQGSLLEGTLTNDGFNKSYVGTFKNNAFLKGKLIKSNNSICEGEFSSNGCLKKGVMIYPDREKHEGTFNEWELLVIGTITSPSNQTTVVNLTSHHPSINQSYRYHSEGQIFRPNGDLHEGTFHDAILNFGKITSLNGKIKQVRPSPPSCTIL